LTQKVHLWYTCISSEDIGQVRIWRSSSQGQDYRSKNRVIPA